MIALLIRNWHWAVIAALLACIGIEHIRGNSARTALYQLQAEVADNARKASEAARAEEHRRQTELEGIASNARTQIEQARADAVAADAVSSRLRDDLAAFVNRARKNPPAPIGGKATADPIGVLAVMLNGLDETQGELARYADAARIAGNACTTAYESLSR